MDDSIESCKAVEQKELLWIDFHVCLYKFCREKSEAKLSMHLIKKLKPEEMLMEHQVI